MKKSQVVAFMKSLAQETERNNEKLEAIKAIVKTRDL